MKNDTELVFRPIEKVVKKYKKVIKFKYSCFWDLFYPHDFIIIKLEKKPLKTLMLNILYISD